nr:PREDICTED: proline-rich membrane anchor 1 isoform X1 [Equus przewalskii]
MQAVSPESGRRGPRCSSGTWCCAVAAAGPRCCCTARSTRSGASCSSQLYLVPRRGKLVVRAADHHCGMLRLPGVSHCACHHLLQSHQKETTKKRGERHQCC